ncbi:MAG: hypothetical protein WAT39_16095, partial [Planctomycetota bacterium]
LWAMLASAIVLAPPDTSPRLADLELEHATPGADELSPAALPPLHNPRFDALLVNNPQIGLAWLVDAALRRATGSVPLDNGDGRGYLAEVRAFPA